MSVIVFGAGGHGKVVADVLAAAGLEVLGFVDDDEARQGRRVLGKPVLGDSVWLREHAARAPVAIALGIGSNHARALIAGRARAWGATLVTAIHPAATVSPSARIGAGTVIMAGACVNPDAAIGEGVIVNTGAIVEHDCILGDWSHLSPRVALGGAARVGAGAHLGLGAIVLPGVCVGDRSIVGAGAVVVRDLLADVVAWGVPARVGRQLAS